MRIQILILRFKGLIQHTHFALTFPSRTVWPVVQIYLRLQSAAFSACITRGLRLTATHSSKMMVGVVVHVSWRVQKTMQILPQIESQRT